MNKKTKITLIAFLVAALVGTSVYFMSNKKTEERSTENPTEDITDESFKNTGGDSSKATKEYFSKKGAANKLAKAMNELYNKHGDKLYNLAAELSSKPNAWDKVVDKNFINRYIRTVDILDQDEVDGISISGLAVLTDNIKSITKKEEPIEVKYNLEQTVYLDEKMKMAYVPLDVFTGKAGIISIEMVYIDGEWKVVPYSMIQQAIAIGIEKENNKKGE